MEKNKQIFIFLILVGIVLVFYSGHLLLSRAELDKPMSSMIIKQGDAYLVRFDITNTDPEDINYTLSVLVDGERYNEKILLRSGKIFTYDHHIYPPLQDNRVHVSIYRENEPVPVSENIYTIGG